MVRLMPKIGFVLISFLFPIASFSLPPVKSVVFFGDSLTDSGNMVQLLKKDPDEKATHFWLQPFKHFVYSTTLALAKELQVPEETFKNTLQLLQHTLDKELSQSLVYSLTKLRKDFVFPEPPYWHDHFSNGPLWNEYLAWMLALNENNKKTFLNYAYAGSWLGPFMPPFNAWELFSQPLTTIQSWLQNQWMPSSLGVAVETYLFSHPHVSSKTLFFIFSGNNDYIHSLLLPENYDAIHRSHYVDNVLKQLQFSLQRLLEAHAQQLIIMGLPHLGNSPKFIQSPLDKETLNSAIDRHNEQLQIMLAHLQKSYPHVDVLYVDTNETLERILSAPNEYGFQHVSQPCLQKESTNPDATYTLCKKPQEYIFWDDIHPTTQVHSILAWVVCERMKEHGYQVTCKR